MKAADILPILQRWADAVKAANAALDTLDALLGFAPESPLPSAIYDLLALADEWAAERIGTAPDWFSWFRLENSMGAAGMQAGWAGDLRHIHTLEDFAALLGEELRRAVAA